jgi:biotin carboxyl carrier protein
MADAGELANRRPEVMEFEFLVDEAVYRISAEKKEKSFLISEKGNVVEADFQWITENSASLLIGEKSYQAYIGRDKEKKYIFIDGRQFIVRPRDKDISAAAGALQKGDDRAPEGSLVIMSPMPGKVIKINVAEADAVRKNQTLAIVEAMKMENEIKSSIEGFVKKIFVAAGDLVDSTKPLIELSQKK